MASLNNTPLLSPIDLYSSFTEVPSGLQVGALQFGQNGKAFRLVQAGGSALVVGNLLQSSAVDTQFDDLAVASNAAIGSMSITLTNGTTAVVVDDFAGGTAEVSVTPGLGDEYTIVNTSAAANGASLVVYLDRPLRTAITAAASKITLRKSPWADVIQAPASGSCTGTPAGIAIYAIPASAYGWVQTKGVAAVLSDNSTFAVGSALANSAATAGCVGVFVAGTTRQFIGHAMRAAGSAKTIPVQLCID
jgi:hypothetical protein